MPDSVCFVDPLPALVGFGAEGPELRPGALRWLLQQEGRLGLLANRHPTHDLPSILEGLGVRELFHDELILLLGDVSCRLPDARAFSLAAALARTDLDGITFVSATVAYRQAAEAAGVEARIWQDEMPQAVLASDSEVADEAPAAAYWLRGRVVTMGSPSSVIEDGKVLVLGHRIRQVSEASASAPDGFQDAPTIETGGTIYPGLIDLHNHYAYNVLPLWKVPQQYENRRQWPNHSEYKNRISMPLRTIAGYSPTARALVRYVEAKALIGGTTTGQGIRTRVKGGVSLFGGAMRNVETPRHDVLSPASTRVPDLYSQQYEAFRRALEGRKAVFYHLAEGTDDNARDRFLDLQDNDLIADSLVGIHSLGLEPVDLATLGEAEAKVVWSPLSNLLLYGATIPPSRLVESGVRFSIGCDWAPSGSKNLLGELKVARAVVEAEGASSLSSEDLVRAVTRDAAYVTAWEEHVGEIRADAFADLVVISGATGDAYDRLIDATERDIDLVVIDGEAVYGDAELIAELWPVAEELEDWDCDGRAKRFRFERGDSPLAGLSLADSVSRLSDAMSDLHETRRLSQEARGGLRALGLDWPEFMVVLDNELDDLDGGGPGLLADWSQMADEVPLDALTGDDANYVAVVLAQPNLPQYVKDLFA